MDSSGPSAYTVARRFWDLATNYDSSKTEITKKDYLLLPEFKENLIVLESTPSGFGVVSPTEPSYPQIMFSLEDNNLS